MDWIAYSALMFVSSLALYLVVRKSSLAKIPGDHTNLAMFAIPLIVYLFMGFAGSEQLSLEFSQLSILFFVSLIFAYGGNKTSLKAIGVAPNPGYSLVISKSYVLFTTLVAVVLLDADLSLRKSLAILAIVGFSTLIFINPKEAKKAKDYGWVTLSFFAFFAWGMLSLMSKYLFNDGVDTITFLIYLYGLVTFFILAIDKVKISEIATGSRQVKVLLIATGLFSTLFNLGNFQAIKLAPNVGYVNAINAASIALVTVFASLMFKDQLTLKKAVGVVGVTLGLVLLLV